MIIIHHHIKEQVLRHYSMTPPVLFLKRTEHQWFSKCGLQKSISITRDGVRIADSQSPGQTY